MFKKISTLLISAAFIITLSPHQAQAEYPTCTYTEGMYLCYADGRMKAVYCNYNNNQETIKNCQERISENHKYKRYFRKKWKRHCDSGRKKRGEYCQDLNENFEFYRDEFLNLFLEEMPEYK